MTFLPDSLHLTDEQIKRQIEDYKHLHAHPELSHQEKETAKFIENFFNKLELASGTERKIFRIGETGVVLALTRGEGPVVGFRADTDGLPMAEETGLDYASKAKATIDGKEVDVMHGCGHDAHIVGALYAAETLAKDTGWKGTALFILQPAEETADGAQTMVDAGLWEQVPHPEILFGSHVFPIERGTFVLKGGEFLAASDSMKVTVYGEGAHGSQPERSVDPIVMASAMITRLQTIVSREVSPLESAVVTVGMFQGGFKENIISNTAMFTLNVRTFNPEVREKVLSSIKRIIEGEAVVAGAPKPPEFEVLPGFPYTQNDADATADLQKVFFEEFGEDRVNTDPSIRYMGSEDFSTLATTLGIPYVFWVFGGYSADVINGDGPVYSNHSPYFAPDPEETLAGASHAALTALYSKLGKK